MPFPEQDRPSRHFDPTGVNERLGVCFHHSVLDFEAAIARLQNPATRATYHVLIDTDGTRARLVEDHRIAWHAGVSSFLGRTHCNAFLLGVSFAGDTYAAPLTEAQIASALDWLAPRWHAHAWTSAVMTDHRQVAPGRKDDLNPVEWTRLLAAISARFTPST